MEGRYNARAWGFGSSGLGLECLDLSCYTSARPKECVVEKPKNIMLQRYTRRVTRMTGCKSSVGFNKCSMAICLLSALSSLLFCCHSPCKKNERFIDGRCRKDPKECGDPTPAPQCNFYLDATSCAETGGYYSIAFDWYCDCPTGDSGCPCWHADHCQGECIGDSSTDPEACAKTDIGHCSDSRYEVGCLCRLERSDPTRFWIWCAD